MKIPEGDPVHRLGRNKVETLCEFAAPLEITTSKSYVLKIIFHASY